VLAWFDEALRPESAWRQRQRALVGALSLGGRERIMVVEVGDQWIVVGASPGRVNALATMPKGRKGPRSPPACIRTSRPPQFRRLAQTDDRQT
jgi:flagellar protein FliO/FliZ